MDILIAFLLYAVSMVICIITGNTMVIALIIGLVAFVVLSMKKGHKAGQVVKYGCSGMKDALIVGKVMVLIGFITATWRTAGTITFFVYYGVKLITPSMFIVVTFLLCSLLSYALGTSFGVAGTAGVIFITLARSGGVNEIVTAGAIMSGIYFGDRGSPASSSAILVATVTHTEFFKNLKMMMRTVIIPFGITLALYVAVSFGNPIKTIDQGVLTDLSREFSLSWWCVVPAVFMLVLPFLKVKVTYAMIVSIISAIGVSVLIQDAPISSVLKYCITGYEAKGEGLGKLLNGGGFVSMIEVLFIIAISTSISGIFSGTDMLKELQDKIESMAGKIGRFWTTCVVGLGTIAVFCNQTIATMTSNDLLKKPYENSGGSNEELAIDMENSVIVLSGVVPWALACSVPLKFLQVGFGAIPWSFLLFLIPVTYGLTKKKFFPTKN